MPSDPMTSAASDARTVVDVHREVALAQLQVAHEALYQALLWSILPAGQGSVLTGPQAESLVFAKEAVVQLRRSAEADLIAATCNALSAGMDAERVLALVREEVERGAD